MSFSAQKWLVAAALLSLAASTQAAPQAEPGDVGLRHDPQVLADYGALSGPVTTWPISWDAVLHDLERVKAEEMVLPNRVLPTFERILARAQREAARGRASFEFGIAGAEAPTNIRGFADTPREEAQANAGVAWASNRFSVDLNVAGVESPASRLPQGRRSVQQVVTRHAVCLKHLTQVLQRIDLYLANAFPRHTDFPADVFQRFPPVAVQPEAAFHDCTLCVAEFADPVIHDRGHIVTVRPPRRFTGSPCGKAFDRTITILVRTATAQRHTLVQRHQSPDVFLVAAEQFRYFRNARRPPRHLPHAVRGAQARVDVLDHVYRQPHRT